MNEKTVGYIVRSKGKTHEKARKKAEELGMSLNSYINDLIEWDNPEKEQKPKFRPRPKK